MALLDLQVLEVAEAPGNNGKRPPGSRSSKGCPGGGGGVSALSLLLCI